MSDFDEYIKNKYPSDYLLMKVRYPDQELSELYSDQFEVWQHQQAIINNLKAQVNSLKHQKSLQELEISQISQANQEWQRVNGELAKALRGASD